MIPQPLDLGEINRSCDPVECDPPQTAVQIYFLGPRYSAPFLSSFCATKTGDIFDAQVRILYMLYLSQLAVDLPTLVVARRLRQRLPSLRRRARSADGLILLSVYSSLMETQCSVVDDIGDKHAEIKESLSTSV
ncbi:hypothetical protein K438DRAFT_1992801 [Mycena galopus ATCC 62051]|nr:hypothetical protein K438DRAFT_1992801 [Mycena galopus ATCC 62051]